MNNLLNLDKNTVYTFLDFETYNLLLNFVGNKCWQTGLIQLKDKEIIKRADLIVKWPNPPKFDPETIKMIYKGAQTVESLNARIAKEGLAPEKAFEITYQYCEECDKIVGHNILGFDLYLLRAWCELMGKPWKHFPEKMIDTHCLIKGMKLNIPYKKEDNFLEYQYKILNTIVKGVKTRLEVVGKEMNIDHDYAKLHDALVDLHLNIKVWNQVKYKLEL